MEESQAPERGAGERAHTRSDKRRGELVRAAYQTLAERGFEGLRVREIAAEAGVNIATLHYYFPTKEDLVRGVVEYTFQQFLTLTAPVPPGYQDTPPEQVRQVFSDLRYQFEQEPTLFVVLNELHLHAQRNPVVLQALQGLNRGWQAHLESVLRAGIEQRFFRENLDAQQIASTIIALVKGISLQMASQLAILDIEQIGSMVVQGLLPVESL